MNKYFDENTEYMNSIKFELYPTQEQFEKIKLFIKANDYFYNFAIDLEEEAYKNHSINPEIPGFRNKFDIQKDISEEKKRIDFLNNIPLHICRGGAFRAIDAYNYFFKNPSIYNKPNKKSINNKSKSYSVRTDRLHFIDNKYIKIEGIDSLIKCFYKNEWFGKGIYKPIIFIDTCNRTWLSFSTVYQKIFLSIPKSEPIGIDIGFRKDNSNTIVCSNGVIFNQPDISNLEKRLSDLDNLCSRDNYRISEMAKEKGVSFYDIPLSNAILERRLKLNKLYAKIHNIKNSFYDQSIAQIISWNPEYICIEDLVIDQLQNQNKFIDFGHVLAFSIREKLEKKCNAYNIPLFIINNKFYPSSKICSNCHYDYNINRCSDYFICPNCGLKINRDLNAAINLKKYPKYIFI